MTDRPVPNSGIHSVRGAVRGLLLAGWSFWCWIAFESTRVLWQILGARSPHPQSRWLKRWSSGVLRILGIEISRGGDSTQLPEPPYLLVSNHLSYLDIVVYGALTGASFLSKAEVRDWPVIGFLSRRLGTLYVKRESPRDAARALAEIRFRLEEGTVVAVFPEATSSDGSRVLPFHGALFDAPVKAATPTLCAALRYETPAGFDPAEWVCWWRDMTFPDHLWGLLTLPWVRAHVVVGSLLRGEDDRRALAGMASREVAALHEKLRRGLL